MSACGVVSNVLRILSCLFLIGYGHPLSGSALQYKTGHTYIYSYVTVTSFNNHVTSSRAANQVGFSILTNVHITPIWSSGNTAFIKLSIVEPRLRSSSRNNESRDQLNLPRLPVYYEWVEGRAGRVYTVSGDSALSANIKKGIVSLFQIKLQDSNHTEIDSSGSCDVSYSIVDDGATILKTKSNCNNLDLTARYNQVNDLLGVTVTSLNTVRYEVKQHVLHTVRGQENWVTKVNLMPELSAHLTASQNLTLVGLEAHPELELQAEGVEQLIKKINKGSDGELIGSGLGSLFESRQCSVSECTKVKEVVSRLRSGLRSQVIGQSSTSGTFLEVVEVMRRSSSDEIYQQLTDPANKDIVLSLLDAAAAAQTLSSETAVMKLLKFSSDHEHDVTMCERWLLAASLTTHPSHTLINQLLKLYRQRVPDLRLRESISEALGAVVRTYHRAMEINNNNKNSDALQLLVEIERILVSELLDCSSANCRMIAVRTLCNAALPSTLPQLLSTAETSNDTSVSEAAVKAISSFNTNLITPQVKRRLMEIFVERRRRYDTSVRQQSLSLLLSLSSLSVRDVTDIILTSHNTLNTEFNKFTQVKLFNSAHHNHALRHLLLEALKDPRVSNYHTLAPLGKSISFTSLFSQEPVTQYHMYVENSRSGLMKRSGMDIRVKGAGQTLPVYNFGIQAAGLESMLGEGEVDEADKDVEVTAGLSLDMIGVSLRPITFFTGQSGLMSAIWNAPSELMSALQTNFLLQDHSERIHLHNGLVTELSVLGATSLDLSGSLTVSLWNKNAKSLIKNSAGITIQGRFELMTSTFQTGSQFSVSGGSCIDFKTDVDFYDGVKLCLKMSRPPFQLVQNTTLYESARGFTRSYRVQRSRRSLVSALSYPLPASNYQQCNIMDAANS